MTRAYELAPLASGHRCHGRSTLAQAWFGKDSVVVIVAALLVIGVWSGAVFGTRGPGSVQPRKLGAYTGWAELVADPVPFGKGLRVTFEIEDERFDAWVYGAQRRELLDHQAGEYIWLQGDRSALTSGAHRAAVRHVVGRFTPTVIGDAIDGSAIDRASNRVRRALRSVAETTMSPDDAALFTGLVIGDDARQPVEVIEAFRGAGLSHLTAVSGQNVAFVLAAALPLLRRLRPWSRWGATLGVIAWFMALTRFEPSVLRAGVMAILAATSFVRGTEASPVRLLALAVIVLVVFDPMLVWSVGFWLSVGATTGVCVLGPLLQTRLPGPLWLRISLAVTLGAQVGVALPSLLVFQRLPVVSIPANLLAVPVAGFVMLYGLPAGLVASGTPSAAQELLMLPAELGTHWVALVARVGNAMEPAPAWSASCWLIVLLAWLIWWRSRAGATRVPI
jgi:competence protein ComEC